MQRLEGTEAERLQLLRSTNVDQTVPLSLILRDNRLPFLELARVLKRQI